jgi:homoserine dehydrogenase
VALREVAPADPFALVEGTSSILRIVTDLAGTLVVTEEHPDIRVTAYGVVSDLMAIAATVRASSAAPDRPARPATGGGSRSRRRTRAR